MNLELRLDDNSLLTGIGLAVRARALVLSWRAHRRSGRARATAGDVRGEPMKDVRLIGLSDEAWDLLAWWPWLPEAEQTALVYAVLSCAGAACRGERSAFKAADANPLVIGGFDPVI